MRGRGRRSHVGSVSWQQAAGCRCRYRPPSQRSMWLSHKQYTAFGEPNKATPLGGKNITVDLLVLFVYYFVRKEHTEFSPVETILT